MVQVTNRIKVARFHLLQSRRPEDLQYTVLGNADRRVSLSRRVSFAPVCRVLGVPRVFRYGWISPRTSY